MRAVFAEHQLPAEGRFIGRIPVRNIWLLFLYASNLARFHGQHMAAVEESPDFPSLVARLLCYAVDRRLRRNLSRGYQSRQAILPRVRGRIDVLETFSGDLLSRGMIACRFEEFTFDTPRNRLVRAALGAMAARVDDATLGHECARLASDLGRQGVGGMKPSRAEMSADRIGRHDADDLLMVTLARLVFDLILPMEDQGGHAMTRVEKDAVLVRQLFEKAIGNFYAAELTSLGWKVLQGKRLSWQIERATAGITAILPGMTSDIILDHALLEQRVVIDTKFTSVLSSSQHREAVLKSGYIYQLYTYLRSQERPEDPLSLRASGMFIHPSMEGDLDETVRIQGHDIRFATVDLILPTASIIARLRALVPR
ncbi:5-methylcytosine-specific restriction endonuclease system specificity protein McrC [Sinorhizobium meliloti]|uniref:5-methylcytosine-specific restriction endonuclease system specificity protein McrC n=1 Tax=Rhizobium meliloti TaxID=382 RepID=UPI0012955D68|nr:5-methylcytosine-specific restriction endonuclease system specificity protein McrC [Sinorhizobium meliloti]MDW9378532.1 5-methylcytosine-specific restriction endonuclease system specificity protein McrC [Sinorhizobium meliloti]MDW9496868.1 5-methylcytosine-specific restriction endonuclease system specificity protein McrC [Sinorhizobium meliloti]MDW9652872.1 5-methylcytosine-specific restriction endonuclease system specificity protein McrC [Sinorhizobium meliloti]MDW9863279.1 5-methylcytosine